MIAHSEPRVPHPDAVSLLRPRGCAFLLSFRGLDLCARLAPLG
jgi:hypothetical protein